MKTMRALFLAVLICTTFLTISCVKKTEISGTVLTVRSLPVPNARLTLPYSEGGKSQSVGSYNLVTDAAGKFFFNERIPKKRSITFINVTSDSGRAEVPGFQATKNMEIIVK